MKIKRKKRIICLILTCLLLLQSFNTSYLKAQASEWVIGGEVVAGSAGLTFGTGGVGLLLLLGGLGITVAWENREEIKDTVVATGEKIQGDFENFCDKAGTTIQSAQAEYDDFMDKLSKGVCDTASKFYDLFKKFVGELSGTEANDSGLKVTNRTEKSITISGAGTFLVYKDKDGDSHYLCVEKLVDYFGKVLTPTLEFKLWSNGYDMNAEFLREDDVRLDKMYYGWGTTPSEAQSNVSAHTVTYGTDTMIMRQFYIGTCIWTIITGGLQVGSAPAYSGYTFPQVHPNYGNTSTWDVSDTDPFGISRPHDGIGRDIPITKPIEDVPDKPVLNPETGGYEWTNTWDKVIGKDIPISDLINVGVVEIPEEDVPGKLWVNGKETDIPIEDSLPRPRETVEPTEEPKPTEEPDEETKKLRDKTVRPDLKKLFPFCIPFDLYNIVAKFDAEPKAPEFTWKFIVGFNGSKPRYQTVRFKFNDFDSVAKVLRNMEKILFIVGIMMITRDKILKS